MFAQINGSVTATSLTAGATASAAQVVASSGSVNLRNGAVIQFDGVTQPQLPVTASNGQFVVYNGSNYIARTIAFSDVQYLTNTAGIVVSQLVSGTTYTLNVRNLTLSDLNPLISANGGTNGQFLQVTSSGTFAFASEDSSVLTTKGDLLTIGTSGSPPIRLPVGANGSFLRANSTATGGFDYAFTSVGNNTIIGTNTPTTLSASTTTIYGTNSGNALNGANASCFFGDQCGVAVTSGSSNCAYGQLSLNTNQTGVENACFGSRSGVGVTSSYNVCIGARTMGAANSNQGNTAVGWGCGASMTAADFCGLGFNSMTAATGARNTAIGARCGVIVSSGADNTFVGAAVAPVATTGSNNVIVGSGTGNQLTTGSGNTFLGVGAGAAVTTGANNICIGNIAGVNTTSNITYVANVRTNTITTGGTAVQVGANGNLGIASSSQRFKQNIVPMSTQSTIHTRFMQLTPSTFTYRLPDQTLQYGLIAEQVLPLFPELIIYDDKVDPNMQLLPADQAVMNANNAAKNAATTTAAWNTAVAAAQQPFGIRYEQIISILVSEVQQLNAALAAETTARLAITARLDAIVAQLNKRILGGGFV